MAKLYFSIGDNCLKPFDEDSERFLMRKKRFSLIEVDAVEPRNNEFKKKYFALIRTAYGYWSESVGVMHIEHGGDIIEVLPSLDKFRSDITIRAGYSNQCFGVDGNLDLTAKSISFAKMTEQEFSDLYQRTITVLMNIMPSHIREADLYNFENNILSYA